MKLVRFEASSVHGYLDFNVEFRPDVNFFAGLNGSGKTTALKMIMAMLTPSLESLRDLEFTNSKLAIEDKNNITNLIFNKDEDGLEVIVSKNWTIQHKEKYDWNTITNLRTRGIIRSFSGGAIDYINKIASPIFLSLDRRFIKSSTDEEHHSHYASHGIDRTHYAQALGRVGRRTRTGDTSIDEVIAMINNASMRAKNIQAREDKKLRDNIILDSLSFAEADVRAQFPSRTTLHDLRSKQVAIRKTLDNLDVSNKDLDEKFDSFFLKLEKIVNKIEKFGDIEKTAFDIEIVNDDFQEAVSEWVINQNQLKRIDRLFDLVQKYQIKKRGIYKDLTRLESLINSFLSETGKSININQFGEIKIRFANTERDLSVLSSGERQILIMFVHLVLDKEIKDGIFIIDEPELSLHISWQDMFVDSVLEANPNLQVILATHSPSIIGGRNHMYVPLNKGK